MRTLSISQLATDILVLSAAVLLGGLSWLVPKRRGEIVFYPAFAPHGFSGNLRPLFEHMAANPGAGERLVWLTRSPAVAAQLGAQGRNVHLSRGRPLWTLLRAETIILDTPEPRLGFGRYRMVQTWHGAGFKRVGLEDRGQSPIRRTALRAHFRRYALIAAGSAEDAARKVQCFANPNVRIVGAPENDALLERGSGKPLAARLGLTGSQRVIAYCPTYRESGEVRPFSTAGWRAIDRWLVAEDALLLVKRHRHDRALKVPEGLTRVRDVSALVDDVGQLLALTDVLISDYSSITTSFALTGHPIVFYLYDAEAYRTYCRELYYDLGEVLPGPFVDDEAALLAALADLTWFDKPDYRARYARFRERFHHYGDAGATVRLTEAVEEIISGDVRLSAESRRGRDHS